MQYHTYSSTELFQTCRQKYKYRYIDNLVPIETPTPFVFGSAIHEALETWHGLTTPYRDQAALDMISANERLSPEDRIKARALFSRYIEIYPEESFDVIDIEREFEIRVKNPDTGYSMHHCRYTGKADGVTRWNGALCIFEHKTTSKIDDGYKFRIAIDDQIVLYAIALEEIYHEPIYGALY